MRYRVKMSLSENKIKKLEHQKANLEAQVTRLTTEVDRLKAETNTLLSQAPAVTAPTSTTISSTPTPLSSAKRTRDEIPGPSTQNESQQAPLIITKSPSAPSPPVTKKIRVTKVAKLPHPSTSRSSAASVETVTESTPLEPEPLTTIAASDEASLDTAHELETKPSSIVIAEEPVVQETTVEPEVEEIYDAMEDVAESAEEPEVIEPEEGVFKVADFLVRSSRRIRNRGDGSRRASGYASSVGGFRRSGRNG